MMNYLTLNLFVVFFLTNEKSSYWILPWNFRLQLAVSTKLSQSVAASFQNVCTKTFLCRFYLLLTCLHLLFHFYLRRVVLHSVL